MNRSISYLKVNKVQSAACISTIDCVIIMADKHTSETIYLSLKEKGKMSCVSNTVLL